MKHHFQVACAILLALLVVPIMVAYGAWLVLAHQWNEIMAKPNLKAFAIVAAVALIGWIISKWL